MLWLTLAFGGTETLTTRDGVDLVAEVRLADDRKAPGVVLLHMIPPHYDRTSWPESFLKALTAKGYSICVPDRRGAGDSKGVAKQAYTGSKGKYDVDACVQRLSTHGIGKLAILGASNGTTSMLDYTAWAATNDLADPVWLGFLTGGRYTEAQTSMKSVDHVPALFTFSTEERAWSVAQSGSLWKHVEFPGGQHGTKMFAVEPTFGEQLIAAMAARL